MKFKFSLQKVQDLREKLEENAKEELGKKIQQRLIEENRLEEINNEIKEYNKLFDLYLKSQISSAKIQEMIRYRQSLNNKRDLQVRIYQKSLLEEDKSRNIYLEKKMDKDILNKLKIRKKEEYDIEQKKNDIKELDEIAQTMYLNKNQEG
ncbi:flagellar export protein FliJ [Geotoga petraea]|jgi:flagellar FliJ protein|uniref:Flagellar FliJ protein n=1 Tax=Geotoga petraea TaxID=28234 RepID=A0A1G6JV91_9BACT|nr:flagellar export protein FliJ [Geotoga petraea]MDK2945689.1 flagellar protein FliJ [Geotoga sp.]TGG88331.1 flagellar export protein FliJ [Geotoga petraea]SDC22634.1 flagellar FliJ protein [Geotoga petraea]